MVYRLYTQMTDAAYAVHLHTPLGAHVKVQRPDELELRVVIDGLLALAHELVPTQQFAQQDLDLQQGEVEADAAARARRERHVRAAMAVFYLVRVPAVRVEAERIAPDLGVGMDGVQRGDDDAVGRQAVAAGEDDVGLGGAAGLEGGVVQALRLLDELVHVRQAVGQIGGPGGLVALAVGADNGVLYQLLVQSVLGALVRDEAVNQPRQQGGGCGEAGTGDDQHVGEDEPRREALALVVDGVQEVVDGAGSGQRGVGHGGIGAARLGGDGVDLLLQQRVDGVLDVAEAGGVAERQMAVPLAAGGDLLVEREQAGDVGDDGVQRAVDGVEVAEVLAKREATDGLRRQLEHVLVDVPGLVAGVQLVEDGQGLARARLHQPRVVPHGFRPHRRRQVLVRQPPVLRLRVAEEDGRVVLDAPERVVRVDLLGHVRRLGQAHRRHCRVVREVDRLAHVGGLDDGAVLAEEAIVVAQVVWEDLVEAAYEGEAGRALRRLHCVAIDAQADGGRRRGCGREDVSHRRERLIRVAVEGDARRLCDVEHAADSALEVLELPSGVDVERLRRGDVVSYKVEVTLHDG